MQTDRQAGMCVCVCMDGWMNEWMDGLMDGCTTHTDVKFIKNYHSCFSLYGQE